MELSKLINSTQGDILILSDFNALEELGKELEAEIKKVNSYTIDGSDLKYFMYEIEHGEFEMTLVVKIIGDEHDIRMYTKYAEGSFQDFVNDVPSDFDEDTGGLPTGFILDPSGNEEEDEYLADDPFPIHGFIKNRTNMCAIGEYTYNGEVESTYWATNCLIEWYISDDEDDDNLDDYYSIGFGWDVNLNDLNVLQG